MRTVYTLIRISYFFYFLFFFIYYLFHIDHCYFTITYLYTIKSLQILYANLSQQLHTIKSNLKVLHGQNHRDHHWRN